MPEVYHFGPFTLDAVEHTLEAGGRPVALTRRAFDTLLYLVRHPGRLVTRDELLTAVWGDTIVEENNLNWTVSMVRRALAQEDPGPFIETARGLGYRFVAPVTPVAPGAGVSTVALAPPPPVAKPSWQHRGLTAAAVLAAALLLCGLAWSVLGRREAARAADTPGAAVLPVDPAVQKLYAEGLERLEADDAAAAVERLEKVVAAEPTMAGGWLALARSCEMLGSLRRAEEAALQAVAHSSGLPERQRLDAEATWLGLVNRRPEAVDRRRRVYELSRHAFADGLALAAAESRAGQARDALATVAELRREHPALADDARLSLAEADALALLGEYRALTATAARAVAAARRQGRAEVEVRALKRLALGRVRAGTAADCAPAREEMALARRRAEALGSRFLLAGVLQDFAVVLNTCEGRAGTEAVYLELIDLYRQLGAFGKVAPLLYNMGGDRLDLGDLPGADRLMREALETCQVYRGLCREQFLHPVGINRLHRGELGEARRMIEEGIRRNRELGNRPRLAEAQSFLPDLAAWSGDLTQAVELQRQVLALRAELALPKGLAWGHSDLAWWLAEAGQGAAAREEARRAVALAAAHGDPVLNACSRASLAFAHLAAGELRAADRESARALTLLRPPRKPFCSFQIWRVRAQVLLARGKLAAAEATIDEGLDLARRNGFVTYELRGRLLRAELALARGDADRARHLAAELGPEARAKGFGLIAQGCEALLARAGKP
jgi:DNA-binding winged helix-turn-helix (wHTH) protein